MSPFGLVDDGAHAHRKINHAWALHRGALGLHLLGMSYCADQLTNGVVHDWFVAQKLPHSRERRAIVTALVNAGLWEPVDDGYQIHDWLDFNPSREQIEQRRRKDRQRHKKPRASAGNPNGIHAESERIPPLAPAREAGRGTGMGSLHQDQGDPAVDAREATTNSVHPQLESVLGVFRDLDGQLEIEPAAIESQMRAYPADFLRAAHEVVAWAREPGLRSKSASRLFGAALRRQVAGGFSRDATAPGAPVSAHERAKAERQAARAARIRAAAAQEGSA